MPMISYVVYDAATGEALHLHVEPEGLDTAPEELIQLAGVSESRRLDVAPLPREGAPAGPLRVEAGRLVSADQEMGWADSGGDERDEEPAVPRRYEKRDR